MTTPWTLKGTATEKYLYCISEFENFVRLKDGRVAALDHYYKSQGKPQYAIDHLIDIDQLVNLYSSKASRWAQYAAAYQPEVLLEEWIARNSQ